MCLWRAWIYYPVQLRVAHSRFSQSVTVNILIDVDWEFSQRFSGRDKTNQSFHIWIWIITLSADTKKRSKTPNKINQFGLVALNQE